MCEPGPTSSEVEFNYGETTAEATQVVGAARPGARRQRCFAECAAQPVLPEEVAEWVQFVKGKGVTAVVSLLSPDEVGTYAAPGIEAQMKEGFESYANFNLKDAGAASPAAVLAAITEGVKAGRKVLVHCWGGGGRTGLVQAAWLAQSKGLSAAEAAAAVMGHAQPLGLPRRVDAKALEAFLAEAAAA